MVMLTKTGTALLLLVFMMGCTLQFDVEPERINVSKIAPTTGDDLPIAINLAVIGDVGTDLEAVLESPSGRSLINTYTVFQPGQVRTGTLENFKVALVTRETITRGTRTELTRYISSGGGIIIVEQGAYLEDDGLLPWNTQLGAFIPIIATVSLYVEPLTTKQVEGRLVPSPGRAAPVLFQGYVVGEERNWEIYNVLSRPNSEEIGFVEQSTETGYILHKAILKKDNSNGGTAYYFAYDPVETPALLLNAIESLR